MLWRRMWAIRMGAESVAVGGAACSSGVKPTKAALRDHFDPLYPDFNTEYPDQLRADEFLNEFAAYMRAREENEGAGISVAGVRVAIFS